MARYVDAELLEVDLWDSFNAWKDDDMGYTVEQVKNIPTADVVEVKHGHWVSSAGWLENADGIFLCSVCGKADANGVGNYCQWCGTKMDEEVE